MARTLRLGPKIALPLKAVTETFGILAVRGAGKSNTAAVMAEEMFAAGLPFVVVDPVGAWWGLRSSRDGTGPGLPLPIFGGGHGDVPLERGGGQLVADLVVDQRLSCVLDLSGFDSEAAKKQFLLDFARRLYHRNTEPLHLFLEEADDYIPQRPMRDEAQLLRAWENIVRRGRARGLGMTLITQRSAAINKNVLTQVQTLIALRTTGPQDRAAIEEWVKYHDQSRDILASLSSLGDGEAWIWSPQLLGTTLRAQFRRRETFDSGATPRLSKGTRAPATLADVDLGSLQQQMAATIERAKQDDPKELRRELADVRRQLVAAQRQAPTPQIQRVEVTVPVLDPDQLHRLEEASDRALQAAQALREAQGEVRQTLDAARALVNRPASPQRPSPPAPRAAPPRAPAVTPRGTGTRDTGSLGSGERKILSALAQYPDGRTLRQIALLTAYTQRGGRFNNLLGALRTAGHLERAGDTARITEAGLAALGDWDPLPTGPALLDHWLRQLPSSEAKVLQAVADAATPIDKEALASRTAYEAGGGRFNNIIGKLRTLELVTRQWPTELAEELR